MEKQDIKLGDFKRIFLGEAPWEFLIEVSIRAIIIYIIFFVTMRLLGKKMAAQLTMFELIIIIVLGAAIALPMESPDKGILPGIVILFFVLLYEKGISFLSYHNYRTEVLTQGEVSIILKDGRIILEEMKHSVLSSQRLFAELRVENITHLGQVERVYLEANGLFSILKYDKELPGLPILPDKDIEIRKMQKIVDNHYACTRCGNIKIGNSLVRERCNYCKNNQWIEAITS